MKLKDNIFEIFTIGTFLASLISEYFDNTGVTALAIFIVWIFLIMPISLAISGRRK